MRKRCEEGCAGVPEQGYITQTFERRGSRVKVVIQRIPADVCSACNHAYIRPETARQIDLLLDPFHGKHQEVPLLPPAEVVIDFQEAIAALKAA